MRLSNCDSYFHILLSDIRCYLRLVNFKSVWRKNNQHNKTTVKNIFPINKVKVGNETYGELNILSFGGDKEGLQIGNYCSIAGDVTFILGGEHARKTMSTFPFARHIFGITDNVDDATKGKIVIGDDVWICHGVIVLSGVHIGQGAIIGAGSVVAKDVPPYAIFIGNEIKSYRFNEEIRKRLECINYSKLTRKKLRAFKEYCCISVDSENVEIIIDRIM